MPSHKLISFPQLHKAKFDTGLAAALPAVPEGSGDAFFATDTSVIYIADTAGTAWDAYDLAAAIAASSTAEDALYLALVGL